MIDKRKHYTMETHYCYSDFDFYKNREGSTEVGRVMFDKLASKAGTELWAVVDTYTLQGRWSTNQILVLQNKEGVQIETGGYGWRNIPTKHDLALKEKQEYNNFIDTLAQMEVPASLHRWYNEAVLEKFEHDFEEILYYGEDE